MTRVAIRVACPVALILIAGCASTQRAATPPPGGLAIRNINEAEIRRRLQERTNSLDPIEGIWHVAGQYRVGNGPPSAFNARVAILRDSLAVGQDFVELYLEADGTFPLYSVTAEFVRGATSGFYIARQLSPDGSATTVRMRLDETGSLVGEAEQAYRDQIATMKWQYTKLEPKAPAVSRPASSTGSGFLVDTLGRFVTNHHVVEDAAEITVVLSQSPRTFTARVETRDAANDLAILKLESFHYRDLYSLSFPIHIAQSSAVGVGESIFTIGYPLVDILGGTARCLWAMLPAFLASMKIHAFSR